MPVWISAVKFNNRLYQILVNGQTGEVIGERPVSKFKVALMWLLVIILIFYIGFIIALQNYWLWGLHIVFIIIAIYIKKCKKNN
jgi:CHASE2 domain-containing sensor protein